MQDLSTESKDLLPGEEQAIALRAVSHLPEVLRQPLLEILRNLRRSGAGMLAIQVAYSILFALPPVLVLTLALGALLEEYSGWGVADFLREAILNYAPDDSQQFLLDLVDQAIVRINPGLASVSAILFLFIALWGSMSGMATLTTATNRAYAVRETRSIVRRWLTIFILACSIPILTIVAASLIFFGESLDTWLQDAIGFSPFGSQFAQVTSAFLILVAGLFLIYALAPNVDHGLRWSMPGALIGGLALLAVFAVFQLVLDHVAVANIYGAASSVIILLYLFRVIGYVYVLGGILNSVLGRTHDQRRIDDMMRHPEKMLFTTGGLEVDPGPGWVV